MFKPNLPCTLRRKTGTDQYGQPTFGAPIPERCSIVRLKTVMDRTTVRADSSATRGHAYEWVSQSRFLLRPSTLAQEGDRLTVNGAAVRIVSMFPRHDVNGRLDHYEVDGEYAG